MKKIVPITLVLSIGLIFTFAFSSCIKKQPKDINIAAVLPMTGDAAKYGVWISQGMQLAVDEINENGGITGRKLKLYVQDSQTNPNEAVKAIKFLIANIKPLAVFTTLTSVSRALIPLAEESKTILFANATLPGLTEGTKYTFRNMTNLSSDVQVAVDYCLKDKGSPPVAIIWRNDDFGLWGSNQFSRLYKESGGKITASVSYEPDTKDFRTHLLKIAESNPKLIYLLSYSEAGYIVKQSKELGYHWEFLGITTLGDPEVKRIAGEALEGTVFTESKFDPKSGEELIQGFQKKYREKYNDDAEVWAATSYDAVKIFALAAEGKGDLTPDRIRENLLGIINYPGVSGRTTFLPNGDVLKPVNLKIIKQGQPVLLK